MERARGAGGAGRWRYVQGLQVILQRQLEALVERYRVGALVCGVAGTVWVRLVAASKVFDEMWVRKVLAVAEAAESQKRSASGGDSLHSCSVIAIERTEQT